MIAAETVVERLRELGCPANLEGMSRYGINTARSFGVKLEHLRPLARELGRDHELALALWASGWREARLLAALVDEPRRVTVEQMDAWVGDFDSWDVCDSVTGHLFRRVPGCLDRAPLWIARDEEFVRRAGLALVAWCAVHHKQSPDEPFLALLDDIESVADDPRNFVKKAAHWALRRIGKRNETLRLAVVGLAERLQSADAAASRFIARETLRELRRG